MKQPLGEYEFSRTGLEMFRRLAQGSASITELARTIGKSKPTGNAVFEKLYRRGLVESVRLGNRRVARVSQAKHAQLLRELINEHPQVSWEDILSYSRILPLLKLANTSPPTASRTTEWRALRALMERGIVSREDEGFKVNPRFRKLEEFIIETLKYDNSRLASQVSPSAAIVWSEGPNFIIRVPKETRVADRRFQKTATTTLAKYGIPLLTNQDYYFFSPNPRRLKAEDVLLHILLTDGVTNTTYALILMGKTRINRKNLIREAGRYQLTDRIQAMIEFLETHREQPNMLLPHWQEYAEKAGDYGLNP